MGVIAALGVGACGAGDRPATTAGGARTKALLGPQAARLPVSAGRSTARYAITAPSPDRYDFDVFLGAPPSADIAVEARTWYGSTLSIFDSRQSV